MSDSDNENDNFDAKMEEDVVPLLENEAEGDNNQNPVAETDNGVETRRVNEVLISFSRLYFMKFRDVHLAVKMRPN